MSIENYLDSAAQLYYKGTPFLSDEQFDRLAESIGYNKVGFRATANIQKHYHRLYSLQKFYDDEDKASPLEGITGLSYTHKLDGAAISVLYVDGKLSRVLTRGDGIEGVDITEKFLGGSVLPNTISNTEIFQVSGEIVAPSHIENARNYASGSLNLKDVEEFKTRAISFFAHDCYPYVTDGYDKELLELKALGFNTVKDNNLELIYPTDGMVYRVNNHEVATEMGHTSKHPRFAYALKTRQDCVETQILSVEWNTGRTGRITPVAILEPITIDEKTISRATLNNPGFIEMLGLRIGDTVGVRLAGQIIPEIVYKCDA